MKLDVGLNSSDASKTNHVHATPCEPGPDSSIVGYLDKQQRQNCNFMSMTFDCLHRHKSQELNTKFTVLDLGINIFESLEI